MEISIGTDALKMTGVNTRSIFNNIVADSVFDGQGGWLCTEF
jgi:hypothetical protein